MDFDALEAAETEDWRSWMSLDHDLMASFEHVYIGDILHIVMRACHVYEGK